MPSLRTAPLLLLFLSGAFASGPGYLSLPVTKGICPSAQRRATDPINLTFNNTQNGETYLIQLGIGTPPQKVWFDVGVSTSNVFVNPNCSATITPADKAPCLATGHFDPSTSSSFVKGDPSAVFTYGIANGYPLASANVSIGTDTIQLGSVAIKSQSLGVATSSYNLSSPILGLGRDALPYDSFITNLAKQGVTQSRAFSLNLRSIDESTGYITFGGVDTGKYVGALEKLPFPDADVPAASGSKYWINLDQVGISTNNGSRHHNSSGLIVRFDSGGTLSVLPQDIYDGLGSSFPTAQYNNATGYYIVDCDVANTPGTIDYTFGGKVIKVLFKDAIFKSPSNGKCVFGAEAIPKGAPRLGILGNSFMRAAYLVFDQDNNNTHIAQAADCGQHIVAISTGVDAVPSITGACPTPTGTLGPGSGSTSTSSGTSTGTSTSTGPAAKGAGALNKVGNGWGMVSLASTLLAMMFSA